MWEEHAEVWLKDAGWERGGWEGDGGGGRWVGEVGGGRMRGNGGEGGGDGVWRAMGK